MPTKIYFNTTICVPEKFVIGIFNLFFYLCIFFFTGFLFHTNSISIYFGLYDQFIMIFDANVFFLIQVKLIYRNLLL